MTVAPFPPQPCQQNLGPKCAWSHSFCLKNNIFSGFLWVRSILITCHTHIHIYIYIEIKLYSKNRDVCFLWTDFPPKASVPLIHLMPCVRKLRTEGAGRTVISAIGLPAWQFHIHWFILIHTFHSFIFINMYTCIYYCHVILFWWSCFRLPDSKVIWPGKISERHNF